MCFDRDALPPELPADLAVVPIAGGAGAEHVEVTAADGTTVACALAESPEGGDVGVVIIPDVRGLYRFYATLAERFAAAGHHAVAFDLFGRTAGAAERDDDFDFWPHVAETTVGGVQADLAAAAQLLRDRTGVSRVVVVGFCFGGMHAYLAATNAGELGLAGSVGFYGALDGSRFGQPNARDEARGTQVPVLALFGGADEGIPADQRQTFEENLAASGAEHEVVVYDGAPHSFFDRKQEEFADASEDAWRRTLAFVRAR